MIPAIVLVAAPALTVACDDLDLPSLQAALVQTINVLQTKAGPPLKFGDRSLSPLEYSNKTLRRLYDLAAAGDKAKLCGALQYQFAWYRYADQRVLFTAYHTPTVKGSLQPDATYRYPLYKRPPGALAKATTAQVLGGALVQKGLELVWLADAYDALALHVEGAAIVELPDGSRLNIGTDGHNGQAYVNVSKQLQAAGKLPAGPPPVSHQPGNPKARRYFAEHPAELNLYWAKNPHYVFFKQVEKAGGGRFGPLIPNRSVAIDADRVPMGAVLWLKAQKPTVESGAITGWVPMERVVIGQDTGAGIKGARIDVYFGEDDYALAAAQQMGVEGDAYVLVAK